MSRNQDDRPERPAAPASDERRLDEASDSAKPPNKRRSARKKTETKKPEAQFVLEELEARILLSTFTLQDPGAASADGAEEQQITAEEVAALSGSRDASSPTTFDDADALDAAAEASAETPADEVRRELVLIDESVDDYDQLLNDLLANSDGTREFEVLLISNARDGIEQITDILNDYSDLDAIHIVSHGTDGAVQLGDGWLSGDTLSGYESQLASWSDAVSADADLLLYGCDLAEGESGEALVGSIAKLTGADVAASDDVTGAAILSGDWALEYTTGEIETSIAFSAEAQQQYAGTLATTTFQEGVSGYTGTLDTEVYSGNPTTPLGSQTSIVNDTDNAGGFSQGLLQFGNLFGNGPGQIPLGSTITSATLTLNVVDTTADPKNIGLHEMLVGWDETSTWDSMSGGIQLNDVEAAATADATIPDTRVSGPITLTGLEATVQSWANGADNNGWAVITTTNDGWDFSSSEAATAGLRPELTIEYVAPTYLTVTTTADSGPGSLRQAILDANATPNSGGPDVITFDIGADGSTQTINLLSALDPINEAVFIDGSSQYGALTPAGPIIEINGAGTTGADGLTLVAGSDGSTIQGLVINRFDNTGITLRDSNNHTIVGNYIGTDVTGLLDRGNGSKGIQVENSASNQIGGATTASRNVISGNGNDGIILWGSGSTLNVIQGNYIGVDATGDAALGNSADGIAIAGGANNNTIGGDRTAGEGNVLSGNSSASSDGIEIDNLGADNNKIYGNYIGTNQDGTAAVANARHGIVIYDGVQGTLIGGTGQGQGNIISGNSAGGIVIDGNGKTSTSGNIIRANLIGVDAAGSGPLGNTDHGIVIFGSASNNRIGGSGAGNVIANSGQTGITIVSGTENAIVQNLIHSNTLVGIDLGSGANNDQNAPVLTSVETTGTQITIEGTLTSTPNTNFRIEFYANATGDPTGYGEGQILIGVADVTTDGSGNISYTPTFNVSVAPGSVISATVSRLDLGDGEIETSEFAQNEVAVASNAAPVNMVPATQIVDEDSSLLLSTSNGNVVSVSDSDSSSVEVTLTVTNGTVSLTNTIGPEFQVNTTTLDQQLEPVVVIAPNDSYVVAWTSKGQDDLDGKKGIYFQRYAADGTAVGSETLVNQATLDDQKSPAIAMDNAGNFVITWSSKGQDDIDGHEGVYARLFNADGTAATNEFLVNQATVDKQNVPKVSMDAVGNFVVVWESTAQDDVDGSQGIYARLFNAAGTPTSSEFLVNQTTADDQNDASVAMDADGDFVVAWASRGQDDVDGKKGVYARQFDASGTALTNEFQVNQTTTGDQKTPSVATDDAGNFVIAWESAGQDYIDGKKGIAARMYDSSAVAQGGEFLVNSTVAGDQTKATVTRTGGGEFIVAWESKNQDNQDAKKGIFAQYFDATGTAQGSEFGVNQTTPLDQKAPSVGINSAGEAIAVWQSKGQDNADAKEGVFGQRFLPPNVLTFTTGDGVDDGLVTFSGSLDYVNRSLDGLVFTPSTDFSGTATIQIDSSDGTEVDSDSFDITVNPVNDAVSNNIPGPQTTVESTPLTFSAGNGNALSISDLDAGAGAIEVTLDGTNGSVTLSGVNGLSFTTGDGTDDPTIVFTGTLADVNAALEGMTFTPLDGFAGDAYLRIVTDDQGNTGSGGAFTDTDTIHVAVTPDAINDAPVNLVPGSQVTPADTPLVFSDSNGNAMAISDDADGNAVQLTLTATNGTLTLSPQIDTETLVNTNTVDDQLNSQVAVAADGSYIVVWEGKTQDNVDGKSGIFAQRHNALGEAEGPEFQVNTFTGGDQQEAAVAMNANGTFVITWQSKDQDGSGTGIYGQLFDNGGGRIGGEFEINSNVENNQSMPAVAMDDTGNFVVTWESKAQDNLDLKTGIYAQRYDATGLALGEEFLVNTETLEDQITPAIAMDADGDFVIVWQSKDQDDPDGMFGVYGQRFNASGVSQGIEFRVNTETLQDQLAPAVAMDDAGNFVVAWQSKDQDGNGIGIYAQRYAANGATQDTEFLVNSTTADDQAAPGIAMRGSGEFVVAWQGKAQDNPDGMFGIYVQRFDASGVAQGTETLVNTTTLEDQTLASVALDADGNAIVSWTSTGQDDVDGSAGVYLQRLPGADAMTYLTGDGVDDAGIVLTGTIGQINEALDGMIFNPGTGFNGTAAVQIDVDDLGNTGTGGPLTDSDLVLISVGTGDMIAPFLVNNTGSTLAEGGTDVISNLELRYDDADQPASSVLYTVTTAPANGQLELTTAPGDAISSFSQAQIDAGQVVYVHDGTETIADSFSFDVDDGSFNTLTGQSFSLTVAPANDAPVATVPGSQITLEDTALVFSAANANAITISDEDANGSAVQVTLTSAAGTLTLASTELLDSVVGDGTGNVVLTGTIDVINGVLDGLQFDPTADFNGATSVGVAVDDLGNTGSGGPLTANENIAITVTSVADNPILGNNALTISEGGTVTLSGAELSATDAETASGLLQFTLSSVIGGQFERVSAPGVAIATFSQAELTAGDIQFVHDGNEGAPSYSITVSDGALTDGPLAATIDFSNVNDNPDATGESYDAVEGVPYTATLGFDDLLLNDSDIEGDTLSVNTAPISGPANGSLVLNADGTFVYTANKNFNGTDSFVYEVSDGNGGTAQATATINVSPREVKILFASSADVNNSKVGGLDSWESGEILGIGDPNLSFEPTGSGGTISQHMDLESFAADDEMVIKGMHYVGISSITVGGTNSVTLQQGDMLFVSQENETMTSTNSLAISAGDVIVFRPDTAGDYSAGTFIHLLDQPGTNLTSGITLVEHDVLVGDITLSAGTFVFTEDAAGPGSNIYHFSADDVGLGTTSGTISTLIDAADLGLTDADFVGLMIVSEDLYLDSTMVAAGSIITSLSLPSDGVGDNAIHINPDELFYLSVSTTTMGSGTTSANATVLFDGGDIKLNSPDKKIRSFTLIEHTLAPNIDPIITLSSGPVNYTEGDPATVIDAGATLADPDSTDFDGGVLLVDFDGTGSLDDRLSIRDEGTGAGQVGLVGDTVTYGGVSIGILAGGSDGTDPLSVTFNASADRAGVEAVIRNITFENVSSDPSTNQRRVEFVITDGDGGVSATVARTVVVNDVNSAPVLTGSNDFDTIAEDGISNGGTLVADLVAGHITDSDPGALAGIAIVGADDTNGDWQYSLDGGTNWSALGAPTAGSALLLAADGSTFVRFVPDPDWNGTVTNGLTFHAWDQTDGTSGDVVNLTLSENLRDQFDTVSYANDDGSAVWTSDWTEISDDGNAATGNVRIENGKLYLDNHDGGATEWAYRSADLSLATNATFSLDFEGYGAGSTDTISVDVSSDGGATWTTVRAGAIVGSPSGTRSFQLEEYTALTSDMVFRFGILAGMTGGSEHISFDNIDISMSGPGTGGSNSLSAASFSSSITVTAINDDPTNAGGLPGSITVTEDVASDVDLSTIALSDVDQGGGDLTVTLSTSTGGNLSATGSAGVIVVGSGTGSLSLTGTQSALNSFLDTTTNIQFLHGTANTFGNAADSISVTVTDNGNVGAGGGGIVSLGDVDVDITAVNDEQTLTTNLGDTVAEGSTGNVVTTAMLQTTDVDDANTQLTYTVDGVPANGTLYRNGVALSVTGTFTQADVDAGLITYDHDGSETASDAFSFTVDDGQGGTTSSAFSWAVTAVNDAPTAVDDSAVVDEGASVLIDLTANDTDPDSALDPTSIVITSGPANGSLVDNLDGTFTYSHDGSETVGDSFSYTIKDASGATSNIASVTLTVTPQNDAPTTGDASATGDEDAASIAITLSGSDVDGTVDAFRLNDLPANGTLYIDAGLTTAATTGLDYTASGESLTFYFVPAGDWNGVTTFDYVAKDDGGALDATAATATITVSSVDDLAVVSGDTSYSGNEGDSAGGDLDATDVEGLSDTTYFTVSSQATNGTAAIDIETGVWTFTQTDPNWFGSDSFEVTVTDDLGGTTTQLISISLASVNDAPTAANDSAAVDEGASVLINLIANDSDPDNALDPTSIVITSGPANGSLVDNLDGTFTYTHDGSETVGDSFSYTIEDVEGLTSNVATVTLTVNPINDAPTTSGLFNVSVSEDGGFSFTDLKARFADAEDPDTSLVFTIVGNTNPALFDSTSINGSGVLTLDYAANQNGASDVTIRATDTGGLFVESTFTVTVNSVNDAPVRTAGTVADLVVAEDSGLTSLGLGSLAYAPGGGADEAGQTLTFEVTVIPDVNFFGKIYLADGTTQVTTGAYSLNDIQGMQFAPVADQNGGPSFFSFRITDSGGTANGGINILSETIQLDITALDDAAVITGDLSFSGNEGDAVAGDLDATDVEGLTDSTYFTVSSAATNGTANIHAETGAWTFTPTDPNWFGSDSFEVTVTDDLGGTTTQLISITLANVDDAAVITGDVSFSGNEGDVVAGDLNATDVDGLTDATYFTVSSVATNGTAAIDAETGAWTFTPTDPNWFGSDSFEVTVTDDLGGTTTQLVSITLANVDDTAVITGDLSYTGNEGDAVAGDLDATDVDGLTDSTYFTISSAATNGTANIHAETGAWTFTATDPNWFGSDSFEVTVTDDLGGTTTQLVSITLANVDDPAVITGDVSFSGNEGDAVAGDLNATDVEGLTDATYFTVSSVATNGTAAIDAETGAWTFTPTDPNWFGSDSFEVTVTDDLGGTTTQLISITLANVDDPAVITGDVSFSGNEGDVVAGDLNATDVDGLTDANYFTVSSAATNGTANIHAETGAWTFTPTDPNWFGSDSFEVTVTDDLGGTTTQIVNITLANVDDAAVITGDVSFSGNEGDAVAGDLDATDVEGLTDSTYFTVSSAATNGTANIHAETGAWTFTPTDSNWFGSDSFEVTVTDDLGGTTTQLVSITLANVDDPAVITGDVSFSGNEGDAVAGDLNATDVEGLTDATYFTVSSVATNGTAAIDAETGDWTFTPTDPNWFGSDSFEVTVTDDLGGTTTQLINITLANVDDAAIISGDLSYNGNEGDAVAGDLDATDVDGLTDSTYFTISSAATNGTANIHAETGAWTFTPTDPNWFGSDSFEVTVTDDLGGTTTQLINITLANVDDAAVITGDVSFSGNEGDAVAGDLDATDVEGLTDATYFTVSSAATNGTANIHAETGAWTFTPTDPNWFGSDSFEVTVTDDLGGTTTQIVNITLANVDDAAVITGDMSFSGNEGDAVAGDLDATDVDGLTDATYFTVSSAATNGTANIHAETGAWTFTPTDSNWFGSDSFEVTVTDDLGGTTTQLINITLANIDDPAVITGDVSFSGNEGDAVAGDLDATDVDGLIDSTYFTVSSAATNGTANIHAETGTWTFTPTDPNWFGSDSFEVTVTDDLGGTTTQLINITLANVDDAAIISGDLSYNGNEGDAVAGDLDATDVDGLTDSTYFTVSSAATNGTANIHAETGAWTFTPTDPNWFGSDSFEVTVTDDLGGTTTQVINVTLANVDDAATITGDILFIGSEGDAVAGDLNATDVDGLTDSTYFTVSSAATNGTAAIDAETGAWTFTPTDANWFGADSFEITVTDDLGGTTTQLVSLVLANVDDSAVITGDTSYSGNEGDAVAGDLDATDVDGLTDGTYFTISAGATNGAAAIDAETGAWTFTPTDPNWFGSDSFEVTVTDDLGGTTTQLINITLANVDDPAVITGDLSFSGNEGDVVAGDLNATDVDGLTDSTYFTVSSAATNGTANIHAETGAWSFTPTDPNWFGSDSFEVTVTDDLGGTTTQLVNITLANVDDAAVITGDVSFSGNEGDAVAGDLNATDVEGLTDATYFTISSAATNGTANIHAETGAWTFTPTDPNWFGSDSFEVTVTDDLGGTTTQLINITLANIDDPAVITGEVSFSGNEGDAVAGDLDATDVEGLTDATYFTVSSAATNGTANIHAETGAWTFTPTDPNWFGSDSFEVTVTDDLGGTTTQLVSITLANVDDAAVITGDVSFSGNEGDAVAGDLNATDVEGLTDSTYFTVSAVATNGTAAIDAETGAWSFTPTDPNWFGSDSFEVTVTDDLGGTTTQLVNITLANVDDAAVITGDVSFSGNEGDAVAGDLNATDVDGLTDATYFTISSAATNGTANIHAETGAWTFTPTDPNWFGSDSFEVTVTDDLGGTTTQIVNITLANVDDAAVITGDMSFSGNEGDAVAGDLDATDVDGLTDSTYFTVSSAATNGTANIHAETGAWTFTPTDPNWFGSDSFEVTVTDDLGGTTTQVINVTLANVDDAATITGDILFLGSEGDAVAGDLNATDVDGLTDSTYFTVSSAATNGTAAIDAETGAWTFTPTDANWFGADSFEITVTDDLGGTTTQLVSLVLANVDDSAVITGDTSYSGNEGDAVAGDLDATDVDGLTDGTYFTISAGATNGAAAIDAETGAWTFTPTDPNWFGSDSFEVTVTDDLGGTTTQLINITLANVDDPAVITGDLSFSGNEGDVVAGDLNATDVDGLTDSTYFTVSSAATNGTANIHAETGAWTFTPTDPNWFGSDSFEVTVTDDLGGTTTQLINITLANVDDAAVITGDVSFSGNEGDAVAGDLDATDVDGLTDATYFTISSAATNGTANIHAETGAWTFTPTDPNWFGSDSFEVTVTDDLGGTTTQLINITLANVDDTAVITGDVSFSGNEGDAVAGDLDATDVEGLTDSTYFTVSAVATNGTAAIDAETGAWSFTPTDPNWFGSDSFEVTVTDDLGGTTTQLINITLANVDDAAVITGDVSFSGNEGDAVAGDLNATDVEGLTDSTYFNVTTPAANGTAVIDAETGAWTFTPTDPNWFGSDNFEVTVTDDLGGTSTQVVNIMLANVDDAALITGDMSFSGNEGDAVAGDLDATDVDGLTDSTYFTVSSAATNGSAAIDAETGAWTFTPTDPNWFGSDSFEVTVTDDLGGTTTQLISIDLTNVDDAAVITGDTSYSGNEGDTAVGDLDATDVEGLTDTTYFTVTTQGSNGTASIDTDTGAWSFTSTDPDWFGSDSFEITVTDDLGGTTTQLVNITLVSQNDAPTANPDSDTALEGATITINLATNDVDIDDALDLASIEIVSGPANGSLVLNGNGTVDYTHNGSETTTDTFSYTIKDASGAVSNTATVSLTITPQNDAPVLTNNSLTISEGGTVVLDSSDLSASDAETATGSLQFTVTNVGGGQFERVSDPGLLITSFTQAEIAAGDIQFVHDGGEAAASYDVSVSDGALIHGPIAATISFTNVNDAPTLDLDSDDSTTVGDGFDSTFTMSAGPVSIVDGDASISDVDNAMLVGLDITITNLMDAGAEFLQADTTGTSIVASYDANTGVLTLSGTDTTANYEQVLRTVTYDNTALPPDASTRTIAFIADDGLDLSTAVQAQVTMVVSNVDPTANPDSASVSEGGSVVIDLAANDTDPETTVDLTSIQITAAPTNGTLVVGNDGTVTYTHDGTETTADSFTYTIQDTDGGVSNVATVNLTITPVNDAPTATGESYSLNEDTALARDAANGVLSDEFDAEGDTLTAQLVTGPTNATSFSLNPDGSFNYVPNADFAGTDQFSYTVSDGTNTTGIVGVTLTVLPINDAPTLANNSGTTVYTSTSSDSITTSELAASDVDDSSADLRFTVTATLAYGHLELSTAPGVAINTFTQADIDAGRLLYLLDDASASSDSFDFDLLDASGANIGVATFNVSIQSMPIDLPGDGTDPSTDPDNPPTQDAPPPTLELDEERDDDPKSEGGPEKQYEPENFLIESRVEINLTMGDAMEREDDDPVADGTSTNAAGPEMRSDERGEPSPETDETIHSVLQLQQQIALALEELDRDRNLNGIDSESDLEFWVANTERVVMAAGLGVVTALLRGGSLAAIAASSVPVWKGLDPVAALLVSSSRRHQRDSEIEFAERLEDETNDVGRILDDDEQGSRSQ